MRYRPKILFTTPILKYPAVGGPYLRIQNSIKALSMISDLYIYYRGSKMQLGWNNAVTYYKGYCSGFYFSKYNYSNLIKIPANMITEKFFNTRLFNTTLESEDNYRRLLKIAKTLNPNIIWLGYGNISYDLLKFIKNNSNYKVVLDTDSVLSKYLLRGSEIETDFKYRKQLKNEGRIKQIEEKWGTQISDVTTAVSTIDAQYYRTLIRNPDKIHLFSNVVDLKFYENDLSSPHNLKKPYIYLAGSFASKSPMRDAACWIIDEVLPLVHKKIPNLHFYIVGKGSKESLSDIKNPNITVVGELKSVLPYLSQAEVVVVPLRYESGTRYKILEAGACGKPVVSTVLGAEGLEVIHGRNILISDNPVIFAKYIVKLCKDKKYALRIGNDLKKIVTKKYDINALFRQGKIILKYLGLTKK